MIERLEESLELPHQRLLPPHGFPRRESEAQLLRSQSRASRWLFLVLVRVLRARSWPLAISSACSNASSAAHAGSPLAQSIAELQRPLDFFRDYDNTRRPHRALDRQTPLAIFITRIRARPAEQPAPRRSSRQIDSFGKVTLRYLGRLRHIPVGVVLKNRNVRQLVAAGRTA